MKYRYLKKGKKVSSEQIKAQMNFSSVLENSATMLEGNLPKDVITKSGVSRMWFLLLLLPLAAGVYFFTLPSEPLENASQPPIEQQVAEEMPEQTVPLDTIESTLTEKNVTEKDAVVVTKPEPQVSPEPKQKVTETNTVKEKEAAFNKKVEKEDVFIKASPKMGFEEFYAFLDSEIKFPENANSNIFEGYVKVLFAINPDGSISDFEIQESLGESFDKEALRVLKLVNEWSPATFNNEAVRSQLSIKLKFDRDNN